MSTVVLRAAAAWLGVLLVGALAVLGPCARRGDTRRPFAGCGQRAGWRSPTSS